MNNIILNISERAAMRIALEYAGVSEAEFTSSELERDATGAYYAMDFVCEWMEASCYVDAETGEVVGFMTTPVEASYPESAEACFTAA